MRQGALLVLSISRPLEVHDESWRGKNSMSLKPWQNLSCTDRGEAHTILSGILFIDDKAREKGPLKNLFRFSYCLVRTTLLEFQAFRLPRWCRGDFLFLLLLVVPQVPKEMESKEERYDVERERRRISGQVEYASAPLWLWFFSISKISPDIGVL